MVQTFIPFVDYWMVIYYLGEIHKSWSHLYLCSRCAIMPNTSYIIGDTALRSIGRKLLLVVHESLELRRLLIYIVVDTLLHYYPLRFLDLLLILYRLDCINTIKLHILAALLFFPDGLWLWRCLILWLILIDAFQFLINISLYLDYLLIYSFPFFNVFSVGKVAFSLITCWFLII